MAKVKNDNRTSQEAVDSVGPLGDKGPVHDSTVPMGDVQLPSQAETLAKIVADITPAQSALLTTEQLDTLLSRCDTAQQRVVREKRAIGKLSAYLAGIPATTTGLNSFRWYAEFGHHVGAILGITITMPVKGAPQGTAKAIGDTCRAYDCSPETLAAGYGLGNWPKGSAPGFVCEQFARLFHGSDCELHVREMIGKCIAVALRPGIAAGNVKANAVKSA